MDLPLTAPSLEAPAPARGPAAALGWASAGLLYSVGYAAALALTAGATGPQALTAGVLNTVPDLLAAPVALAAVRRRASRGTLGPRLVPLALAFAVWGVLGTAVGFALHHLWRDGSPGSFLDARIAAWKALLSLLVFAAVAAVAVAQVRSDQARVASLRALRAEALGADARLAVLRAQLNPHFLLNILHSLVGLAERDPPATAAALERLGTTLRYALRVQRRGSDRVALREELEFTREYLALERLRLGDRLDARLEVDEASLGVVVPPFVLQPLVENAVRHAIAPRAAGGVVRVALSRDGAALRLVVEDDGPPAPTFPTAGSGLGLTLLRDRIAALYPGQGRLELDRSPLGGLRATVHLPLVAVEEVEP